MLTSAKISLIEPGYNGVEHAAEGQALPQEAKFSELFASMFNGTSEETMSRNTVLPPETLDESESLVGLKGFPIHGAPLAEGLDAKGVEYQTLALIENPNSIVNQDVLNSLSISGEQLVSPLGINESLSSEDDDIMTLVESALNLPAQALGVDGVILAVGKDSSGISVGDVVASDIDMPVDSLSLDGLSTSSQSDVAGLQLSSMHSMKPTNPKEIEEKLTVEDADLTDLNLVSSPEGILLSATQDTKATVQAMNHGASVKVDNPAHSEGVTQEELQESRVLEQNVLQSAMGNPQTVNTTVTPAATPVNSQVVGNSGAGSQAHVTQWGGASNEAALAGSTSAQNGQSFSQGSGQQSFSGQQQMMQFQEQRAQALDQQMQVKVNDELLSKVDSKEGILGGELLTADRRGQLPPGLQAISQPVKSPQWGQALGQRVVFMANNQLQQAQITLNPEKLGPVQVKLHMDKDQQVHVTMTAQHSTTREAMESALPRLREMLEQSGVDLATVDISDDKQFADNQSQDSESHHLNGKSTEQDNDATEEIAPSQVHATDNIVDFYA